MNNNLPLNLTVFEPNKQEKYTKIFIKETDGSVIRSYTCPSNAKNFYIQELTLIVEDRQSTRHLLVEEGS